MKNKNIGILSLGCPRNLVDSEVMLGILESAGYTVVTNPAEAEVLIVNTCGFIEDAKKESIDSILEMAQYKESPRGVCKKLVVAGCLPQRYKSELSRLLPEVDLFVGAGEYNRIAEILRYEDRGLFVGMPNNKHPMAGYWKKEGDWWLDEVNNPLYHEIALSINEFKSELEEAGFYDISCDGCRLWDFIYHYPLSTKPRRALTFLLKALVPEMNKSIRIKYGTWLWCIGRKG